MTTDLRSLPLFAPLSDSEIEDIERSSEVQHWRQRAVLFQEGEDCSGMHFVLTGSVQLYRDHEGKEQIVMIQGPGNALSTVPLLDRGPYPISARAMVTSTTLFLPIDHFNRLFTESTAFHDLIIADLAARHRNALTLLNIIALKPVLGRVATLIVKAAAQANALDGSIEFELPLKQEQLANEVATTREGVARSLARLRREGVIEQRGASIRVLDAEKLLSY